MSNCAQCVCGTRKAIAKKAKALTPLKIGLIVGATYPVVGGTELASFNMAKKLAEHGHKVTIVTRYTQGYLPHLMKQVENMREHERYVDGRLEIHRAKRYPIKFGGAISHLFKSLKVFWRHPPDVILSFSMTKHSFVAMLLHYLLIVIRLRSVPVVVWGRGSMIYEKAKRRGLRAWLIRRLLGFLFRAKKVIAHSPQMMLTLIKLGCDAKKIHVVGNAIDLNDYHVKRTPKKGYVVCVASARKPKGLPYLLRAFTVLPKQIRLTVVGGWGEEEEVCKAIAKGHANIRITGMVHPNKVKKYLANAEIMCIPSLYESFPNVALEGMTMGVPIVSTDVGGLPFVLGDCACFVPPRNEGALAQAIVTLWKSDGLREELGKKSLEQVKEFSWENVLPKLEKVLIEATK